MSEYISSEEGFRSFMESSIWKDMQYELNTWLERIRDALEDQGDTESPEGTSKLRGNAQAIRRVLAMPEAIMQNIAEDREAETDDRGRE